MLKCLKCSLKCLQHFVTSSLELKLSFSFDLNGTLHYDTANNVDKIFRFVLKFVTINCREIFSVKKIIYCKNCCD